MAQRIAIVDYGMGNLRSVQKALAHVAPGAVVEITADPQAIRRADRVVFPGQGAMPDCMKCLDESGLGEAIRESAAAKPFLGLCIGLLPGRVLGFAQAEETRAAGLKIPHMGWNEAWQAGPHPLWAGIPDGARFYFVHSYYCAPAQASLMAAWSRYPHAFTSAIARDNIFATQFHPEKSSAAGLKLLENFSSWTP
jgi:glutamine amidotransferase